MWRIFKFLGKVAFKLTVYAAFFITVLVLSTQSRQFHNWALTLKVVPTVVLVGSKDGNTRGTGFHLKLPSGNTYLVTNRHICIGSKDKKVLYAKEKEFSEKVIPRKIIKIFENVGLCLLEPFYNYDALSLASGMTQFQDIWYFGYPVHGQSIHMGEGKIKGVRIIDISKELKGGEGIKSKELITVEIDAPTFQGASGSPVVNGLGNVVGVVMAVDLKSHWGLVVPLGILLETFKNY